MIDFCVLGSGIAGSTIANLLSKKYSVHVFDKARGPGGRSSFKRLDQKIGFDHGVQYISPKNDEFKKFTTKLLAKKILKSWKGRHIFKNKKIKFVLVMQILDTKYFNEIETFIEKNNLQFNLLY